MIRYNSPVFAAYGTELRRLPVTGYSGRETHVSVANVRITAHVAPIVGLQSHGNRQQRDQSSSRFTPAGACNGRYPVLTKPSVGCLPTADFERLRPHLKTIELVHEAVLVGAGERLTRVFFPHSGVISLVVSLAGGGMVEVAMVGRDSVFGGSAALIENNSLTDAIVRLPGSASTLEVGVLRIAAEQSIGFRTMLLRHEQALFAQAQQSAACNALHAVEARLARWLLRMHDLAGEDHLHLTQDFLAQMIGVRRNSVSTVAHMLQQAGVIKYARGHIEITNLDALRQASCECYQAVNVHYKRLLS